MATSRYFARKSTIAQRECLTVTSTGTAVREEAVRGTKRTLEITQNLETHQGTVVSKAARANATPTRETDPGTNGQTRGVIDEARAKRIKPSSLEAGSPFCAPPPAKYRCRVKSTCSDCFVGSTDCPHRIETSLDLLLLGHNPSSHVWLHGYNYGQSSNKMWSLLTGDFPKTNAFEGVLPNCMPIESQNELPRSHGVGFIEIAPVPGSDAAEFTDAFMRSWVPNLFSRLRAHVRRVQESSDPSYTGPRIVAFTGKRQFMMMFPSKGSEPEENIGFGRVSYSLLPESWPFPETTQVWVLTSSSGRAAMTNQQRADPYINLANEFRNISLYRRNQQ